MPLDSRLETAVKRVTENFEHAERKGSLRHGWYANMRYWDVQVLLEFAREALDARNRDSQVE